ncbi:hypothetical protein KQI84_00605 [bacterium]|nr:hypothetical protein [bacterium]
MSRKSEDYQGAPALRWMGGRALAIPGLGCALILLAILLVVLCALFPDDIGELLGTGSRNATQRARSDMRSIATAIESYWVDHRSYFPIVDGEDFPLQRHFVEPYLDSDLQFFLDPYSDKGRFRLYHNGRVFTRSHDKGTLPYGYWKNGNLWILVSRGPDLDLDLTPEVLEQNLSSDISTLSTWTFDPTNGAASSGDVFRLKE